MRYTRVHSLLLALILGLIFTLGTGEVAFAHGERSQEGFLRMKTAAWQDVRFSSNKMSQGEQLVITGMVKVLEIWPPTLDAPAEGYLNVSASGPHLVMKERIVNGHPAPASFALKKGGEYEFKMVLDGRTPGYWHVHPVLYVHHTGGLIGPGQWITVVAAPGGYQNRVGLMNGQTINLDTYGLGWVFWFSFAGFIPGVWWMLWWTMKHRTVTNLAVTVLSGKVSLNDPGEDIGLITKADHRTSTLIAAISVILLVLGWLYMDQAWPTRMPQQVLRFTPPELAQPAKFVESKASVAIYNARTDTVVLEASVTNTGSQPLQVVGFTTANLMFEQGKQLTADPAMVKPGQTAMVKMTIQDKAWREGRLLPMGESQLGIGGLLVFESGGKRNVVTTEAPVGPTVNELPEP